MPQNEYGQEIDEYGNVIDPTPPTAGGATTPPASTPPSGSPHKAPPGPWDPSLQWNTTDPQAFVQQWLQRTGVRLKQSGSQPDWDNLVAAMRAVGFTGVTLDSRPDGMHKGIKLDGSDASFVKMADGNDNPIWQTGGGNTADGPAIDPSYLAPYTQSFKDFYPQAYGAGTGEPNLPEFHAPGAFQQPTVADVMKDPGYQFREGRLTGAIENSAAARGLTNSGGTVDALKQNVGQFASQEYGNVWNRDFNLWNTDWQHAFDTYATQKGASDTNLNRAWQQYVDSRNQFYTNQDRPFDKLTKGVSTGFGATV